MFYTGARVSEALYLDWVDVDLNRAHASLKETKGGEPRGVPLHPRVIARLADLPHRDGAVFLTHMGRPYAYVDKEHGGQIKRAFSTALKRARIADFTPHDCRHTWATWHYQANRDLRGLQQLGGWKSLKMVERYTHVNVDDLASSVEALPWGKSGKLEKSSSNNKERSAC